MPKKLTTAGPKKMLNLITSQVCFRDIKLCALPLKLLSTMCTNQLYKTIYLPIDPMFTVDAQSVFSLLNNSVFKVIKNRLDTYSNDFLAVTLKLRERLPNFMPSKSNTIVYTSVREAQSATKLDVYKYLNELKLDLQVSCENTPLIVLCGDQQTYSILRDNDKAQFGWFAHILVTGTC